MADAPHLRREGTDAFLASHPLLDGLAVAVLIPCYNEAAAIAKVVTDFRAAS